jgi:hypothetical protein
VKEELVYCGVDIAKSCLNVAVGNEKGRLANDAPDHRKLINWLKEVGGQLQVIANRTAAMSRR